jgi:hypothetical protein
MEQQIDLRREAVIKNARKIGVGLTAGAAVLAPIQEASQGAATVRVPFAGAAGAVILAVLGPAYLIGGGRFVEAIWSSPGPWGFTNYFISILTLPVSVGVIFGLGYYLRTLGYSFF